MKWSNSDNATYYERVPTDIQRGFTVTGGLNTHCDLDVIKDYVHHSNSIFEVGACYGRVLDYLIKNGYPGRISAIERSKKFFDILDSSFNNEVMLYNEDLFKFDCNLHFDLILWLWCGISDFTPTEQQAVIKKLSRYLSKDGTLIIETLSPELSPVNAAISDKQNYFIQQGNCHLYGYIPTPEEISQYAANANVTLINEISYKTTTGRARNLYMLKQNHIVM